MGNEVKKKAVSKKGKATVNSNNDIKRKKIKSRRLYLDKYKDLDGKEEQIDVVDVINNEEDNEELLDKELEKEDNMSIALMVLILVTFFVVGIVVGYFMYRIIIR